MRPAMKAEFVAALATNTRAAWQAVAARMRAEATATPTTTDERDAANVAAYCEYRALHHRGRP